MVTVLQLDAGLYKVWLPIAPCLLFLLKVPRRSHKIWISSCSHLSIRCVSTHTVPIRPPPLISRVRPKALVLTNHGTPQPLAPVSNGTLKSKALTREAPQIRALISGDLKTPTQILIDGIDPAATLRKSPFASTPTPATEASSPPAPPPSSADLPPPSASTSSSIAAAQSPSHHLSSQSQPSFWLADAHHNAVGTPSGIRFDN